MSCLVTLVKAWSGDDRHLDADEAVVLGAGLFAANLSTTFRLRKFGMTDGATFPLMFQVIRLPIVAKLTLLFLGSQARVSRVSLLPCCESRSYQ